VDAELRILEARLLAGEAVAAADLDAAMEAVGRVDDPGILPVWGLRLRAALAARAGDLARADEQLRAAVELACSEGYAVEEVAALEARLALGGDAPPDADGLRRRRDELVATVGIERSLAL
jgi:hypothetical protein